MNFLDFIRQSGNMLPTTIISISLLSLTVLIAFLLKRKYKMLSKSSLNLGLVIYFLSCVICFAIATSLLLFNDGVYINYGLGGSLVRILSSFSISTAVGFVITNVFYSKRY